MASRRRQERSDLTASWDQVESEDSISGHSTFSGSESDDHPTPLARPQNRASPRLSRSSPRLPTSTHSNSPRHRMTRSSVEPQLVMPSMPYDNGLLSSKNGSPRKSSRTDAQRSMTTRKKTERDKKDHRHGRHGQKSWFLSILSALPAWLGPVIYGVWLWLQPFISFGIAISILGYALYLAQAYIGSFLPTPSIALASAICNWPVLGLLPLCPQIPKTKVNPEFDQLVTVQESFEDVLSSASSYAFLPVDMKRSEASIRDLKHVVQYSNLPSRSELVFEFQGFIEMAQQAGFDLTKFNSHVGRALDHITSTNRRTLQVMHGEAEREMARGSISRLVFDGVPAMLGFPAKSIDRILTTQYLVHISVVEDELNRLILEAQALLMVLANLDSRIDVIASVTTRDGVKLTGSRDELLSSLYTYLGGNRGSLKKLDEQLRLLKDVSVYRKTAWNHVNAALLKLQAIQAGLEDLRERVAEPDVLGGVAIPLEQHLEHVKMGVERLELIRNEQRKVDDSNMRRVLEHGSINHGRLVEGAPAEAKTIG